MSDDLRVQVIRFNLGKNYENAKKDTVEVDENIFYSTPVISADTVSADSTNLKPKKGLMITFAKAEDKTEKAEKSKYEFIFSDVKKRHELSWGEIGEIALNSGKNFVKGMFCDENGFSLKRTAMTVGIVVTLACAAPIAAAAGASAAVVAGIAGTAKVAGLGLAAYMTYNGGKNIIEGTQKYYDSTTEAEAKAGMSQAMDGAVEVAAAVPAFGIIKGGAAKGKKMASKKAEAQQNQPAPEGAKPAAEAPKPVEEAPKAETKPVEESKPVEEAPKAETKPVEEPKPVEEAPKAEAKPVEEPKPVEEAPKAETKPVEEPKPVEEAPKAEAKPVEEPKPVEEAPKAEAKPVEESKPVEEAPKAETKPVEESKPTEEAPKAERKFPEPKSLSDEKNLKEFISTLLKDNPKNKDLVKRFLGDLKTYNSPEFTQEAALKALTESAVLLGNRVNVFAHNGKLYLSVDGAGTYSMKLKAGTKPAAEAPKAEPKPVEEVKPVEEAPKVETKPAKEQNSAFKEIDVYTENDFNFSLTKEGYRQLEGNTKQVPDLRRYLAKDAKTGDYAVLEIPSMNATAIVIKIDGRGGDNLTIMVNGKVSQEKIAEFVKYLIDNAHNIKLPDRKLFVDFFNKSNARSTQLPKTNAEPRPVEEAPKEGSSTNPKAAGTSENPISLSNKEGLQAMAAKLKKLYPEWADKADYLCQNTDMLLSVAYQLEAAGISITQNPATKMITFVLKDGSVFCIKN